MCADGGIPQRAKAGAARNMVYREHEEDGTCWVLKTGSRQRVLGAVRGARALSGSGPHPSQRPHWPGREEMHAKRRPDSNCVSRWWSSLRPCCRAASFLCTWALFFLSSSATSDAVAATASDSPPPPSRPTARKAQGQPEPRGSASHSPAIYQQAQQNCGDHTSPARGQVSPGPHLLSATEEPWTPGARAKARGAGPRARTSFLAPFFLRPMSVP